MTIVFPSSARIATESWYSRFSIESGFTIGWLMNAIF
jgi:hypothetical protein